MRKIILGLVLMVFVSYTSTQSLNAQNEAECVTIQTNTRIFYLHKNAKVRVHYSGGKIHSRIKSIGKDHFTTYKGDTKIMFDDIEKMRIYPLGKWPFYAMGIGAALFYPSYSLFLNSNPGGMPWEIPLLGSIISIPIGMTYSLINLVASKEVVKSGYKSGYYYPKHNIQSIEKGEHRKEYSFGKF